MKTENLLCFCVRGAGVEEFLTGRSVHGPAVTDDEDVFLDGVRHGEKDRLDLHHRPEELLLEFECYTIQIKTKRIKFSPSRLQCSGQSEGRMRNIGLKWGLVWNQAKTFIFSTQMPKDATASLLWSQGKLKMGRNRVCHAEISSSNLFRLCLFTLCLYLLYFLSGWPSVY